MNTIDDTTDEVELSTEDLNGLAPISTNTPPARSVVTACQTPAPATTSRKNCGTKSSSPAPSSRSTVYFVAGAASIAVALIAFVLFYGGSTRAAGSSKQWRALPQTADVVNDEVSAPPTPAPPPVRIRNEFDRNEVFEFPAGTSQQEARDQVAQILLQRAIERQRDMTAPKAQSATPL